MINDNSTIIASPINCGFPKGIATTPNAEIKIRVTWHAYFWIPQLKKLKKRYIGKSLPVL